MPGTGGRQVVIGGGSGAPQIAQVIPAQRVVVGRAAVTLDLGDYFSDPDGDALTYAAVSSDTAAATVSVAGAVLTITPVAVGSATVTVTASDATRSAAQQVVVTVAANRAPASVNSLPDRALGAGAKTYNLAPYFSDPDGDTLTYTVVSSDTSVVTAAITGTDLDRVTVTPLQDDMSADITVTASDGLASVDQTFALTVNNRAPRRADGFTYNNEIDLTDTGKSFSRNMNTAFRDPDNDPMTFTAVSSRPADISVSISGSTLTWTILNVAWLGSYDVIVTVTASDGWLSFNRALAFYEEES